MMSTNTLEKKDEMEFLQRQNSMLRCVVRKGIKDGKLDPSDIPSDLVLDNDPSENLEQSSKETVLKRMRSGSLLWQEMPEESPWKCDADVVCAAYEHNRMELPLRGKRSPEEEMMLDIMGNNYDHEIEWKNLPYHLKTNEDVMLHALRAWNGLNLTDLPSKYQNRFPLLHVAILHKKVDLDNMPSELLQSHQDLALFAVQNRRLPAEDCPILDEDFLREAVQEGKLSWKKLPPNLQTDLNFALSINKFLYAELPVHMMQYCPPLRQEEVFWKTLMAEKKFLSFDLLVDFLPQRFCSEFDFMLDLCTTCPSSIRLATTDLLNNRNFIFTVLQKNSFVLEDLSHTIQETHHDHIRLEVLPSLGLRINKDHQGYRRNKSEMLSSLARNTNPSFWSERDFVIAWIKAGLGFPDQHAYHLDVDDQWWYNDHVTCLLHCLVEKKLHPRVKLRYAMSTAFMLRVVKANPSEYKNAEGAAKYSPRVMAAAFAELPKLADQVLSDLYLYEQQDKIDALVEYLNTELEPYDVFCSCILSNMLSNQSMQETGTPITLLNQGIETSFRHKKSIGSYLGIPTGIDLQRLLCARANVQAVIAQWTPGNTSQLPPARSLQATEEFRRLGLDRL